MTVKYWKLVVLAVNRTFWYSWQYCHYCIKIADQKWHIASTLSVSECRVSLWTWDCWL